MELRSAPSPHKVNLENTTCTWVLFFILWLTWGCSNDDDPGVEEDLLFVSSEEIGPRTTDQLIPILQLAGVDIDEENWKYDVERFKINYKTNLQGREVEASALVIVPDTDEKLGMISFHRGTITANREAPTELSSSNLTTILYSGLSSLGLVAVFPDMIGFGTSVETTHPYYVREINANTARDAIIAAKQFVSEQGVNLSGDLYLAGYSQGGYLTMAAQQAIEQTPIRNLRLKASFPAAGAYDVKGLQEYFFTLDTYEQPYYLAYVGVAYQEYLSLDIALSDIFNSPYDDRIPGLFDRTLSGSDINDQLTFNIGELLTEDFLTGLETDQKFSEFKSLLSENGLVDWVPETPTYLYHGDADTFIPVQNSIDTYNKLMDNGTDEDLLELIIFEGADHPGGVIPYAEDVALKLIGFVND